jgi:hypothetical protein
MRVGMSQGAPEASPRVRCDDIAAPAHGSAVHPRRQIELVLEEPQQRLAHAAELGDLVDGEPNCCLDAAVGILFQAVADLHEADRRGDDELAPPRLLVSRRQRPLSQQVELVLVQAALQAEQQAVFALPGRVDRLPVDQERVDPAHLDELLPVAAVAREAGDLPRRHGSNLPETDLGDPALEQGPRGAAGRGAAEILVDDLDLCPAKLHEALAGPRPSTTCSP